jgi:hypothetical protein
MKMSLFNKIAFIGACAILHPQVAFAQDKSADTAAIWKIAADLDRMYETYDETIARDLYARDMEGGPLIFDAGPSPWGEVWTKGYDRYMEHVRMYAKAEGPLKDRPNEYRQDYVKPVLLVGDDGMATLVSELAMSWSGKDGKRESHSGRYTVVFLKTAEGWKVWHEHFSAAMPLPADLMKIATDNAKARP